MGAARELMGDNAYRMVERVGISHFTAKHVLGHVTNKMSIYHIRLAQALLLAHIGGVKETLTDIERELWVTMQLTHHPLVEFNGSYDKHRHTVKKKMMIRIGDTKAARRAKEFPIQGMKLLPIRATAIIKHPDLTPHAAVIKELQEQVDARKIHKRWSNLTNNGNVPATDPRARERARSEGAKIKLRRALKKAGVTIPKTTENPPKRQRMFTKMVLDRTKTPPEA